MVSQHPILSIVPMKRKIGTLTQEFGPWRCREAFASVLYKRSVDKGVHRRVKLQQTNADKNLHLDHYRCTICSTNEVA